MVFVALTVDHVYYPDFELEQNKVVPQRIADLILYLMNVDFQVRKLHEWLKRQFVFGALTVYHVYYTDFEKTREQNKVVPQQIADLILYLMNVDVQIWCADVYQCDNPER